MLDDLTGDEADATTWGNAYCEIYQTKSDRNRERRRSRQERDRARRKSPEAAASRNAKLQAAEANIRARYDEAKRHPNFTATEWQFVEYRAKGGDPDAKLLRNAQFNSCFAPSRRDSQARVRQRLINGFEWPGGLIGENSAYRRSSLVYP